jgi:YVTN family beta-propeller protein
MTWQCPRVCLAFLVATIACDGTDPNLPATLRLTAETVGEDPDPDGYSYSLDQNQALPLGANASVTVAGLAAGGHQLAVGGVASNCVLDGGNPRALSLVGGDTTQISLNFTCQALPVAHPAGNVAQVATLDGAPYGVAVSADGVVYAALIGSNSLARGDVTSMSFGDSVVVGLTPPHVAFNPAGTRVYATLQTGQGLAVVNVATNALVTTVPLASDGFNLAVSPDGRDVYATTADGTLYVVDPATNDIVTTLDVGPAANGLAFSPNGAVLYVSSRDAGTVVAIDRQTHAITRTYILGGAPQRLAVSPDGSEIYVANESHGLDVLDVTSGAFTQTSFGTPGYGLGITPDGDQLYVLLPDAGEVRVLDRATRSPVKTITVGGRPRNVAFTADGRTALIANESAVIFVR